MSSCILDVQEPGKKPRLREGNMWDWNAEAAIDTVIFKDNRYYIQIFIRENSKFSFWLFFFFMKFSSAQRWIVVSSFLVFYIPSSLVLLPSLLVILLENFSNYCIYDNLPGLNFPQISSNEGMRIIFRYEMYATLRVFCPGIVLVIVDNISNNCHLYWMENFVSKEMTISLFFYKGTSR